MYKAKSVASYLIERTGSINENDLTNLKLQKILFYVQSEHLQTKGLPLFAEEIEAWSYGPVVPDVYDWLKGCGAYPISAFDIETNASKELGDIDKIFLNQVWDNYGKYSAAYLVARTHEPGSPWSKIRSERKKIISLEVLKTVPLHNVW